MTQPVTEKVEGQHKCFMQGEPQHASFHVSAQPNTVHTHVVI